MVKGLRTTCNFFNAFFNMVKIRCVVESEGLGIENDDDDDYSTFLESCFRESQAYSQGGLLNCNHTLAGLIIQ